MEQYQAVLLDVDGTLVDSNDAHASAWVEVLAKFGHDTTFDRVRAMIGMGGDRLIEDITGLARDSKENGKIGEARSELFKSQWIHKVRPLPGSRELVLRLKREGYQYAIATAAKDDELQPLLEIANIADLVPTRTTSSEVDESKPDPEVIDAALAKLKAERSRAVMIGDTPYDALAAQAAHVAFIGVLSGGWTAKALKGAAAVYAGPHDLAERWPG